MRSSQRRRVHQTCPSVGGKPNQTWWRIHVEHSLESLAHVLHSPQQYPVVIVAGTTSSIVSNLYRKLPIAAYLAARISSDAHRQSSTGDEKAVVAPQPSLIRVVPHTAAMFGPQGCTDRSSFVEFVGGNVGQAIRFPAQQKASLFESPRVGDDEKAQNACTPSDIGEVQSHRRLACSTFTDDFLANIKWSPTLRWRTGQVSCTRYKSSRQACEIEDPHVPEPDPLTNDGGSAVRTAGGDMESPVQWVVGRWITEKPEDMLRILEGWSTLLPQQRRAGVASLVLFANTDISSVRSFLGDKIRQLDADCRPHSQNKHRYQTYSTVFSPVGCLKCSARRLFLDERGGLGYMLRKLLRKRMVSPTAFSSSESPFGNKSEAGPTCRAPNEDAPDSEQQQQQYRRSRPDTVVTVLRCLDRKEKYAQGNDAATSLIPAWSAVQRACDLEPFLLRQPLKYRALSPAKPHSDLRALPPPLRPSRGVLEQDGTPYPLHSPKGTLMELSRLESYTVVSNPVEREKEQCRALRRNSIDAKTLQLLRTTPTSFSDGERAEVDSMSSSIPCPRYFTTLVADAGSLLRQEGSLSDVFVLEFESSLMSPAQSARLRQFVDFVRERRVPRSNLRRTLAYTRLFSETEAYVALSLPTLASVEALTQAAVELLFQCADGRGAIAWPLVDPKDGLRQPRFAFALTYDFYGRPLQRAMCHRPEMDLDLETAAVAPIGLSPSHGTRLSSASSRAPISAVSPAMCPAGARSRIAHVVQDTVRAILFRFKRFGWTLVWQEDHYRWPTSVEPSCWGSDAARRPTSRFTGLTRSAVDTRLRSRVAASLEIWRREQFLREGKRYDLDPSLASMHQGLSEANEEVRSVARNTATSSSYTSLDLWQAALVPQNSGFFFWEGQTVFLEDGRVGTIVEFRPPPDELFTPWDQHKTELLREQWRGQQRRCAAFIRFYAQYFCRRQRNDPQVLAAAFSSLPHYVRQREMKLFPVVRLLSSSSTHRQCLIHVLPTLVERVTINHPRMRRIPLVAQQQGLQDLSSGYCEKVASPIREEQTLSGDAAHTVSASDVVLLRLPLFPFCILTAGSLYLSKVLKANEFTLGLKSLHEISKIVADGGSELTVRHQLSLDWAKHHRSTNLPFTFDTLRRQSNSEELIGCVRWRSFCGKPYSLSPFLCASSSVNSYGD